MALTRKMLAAMDIPAEKIDEIINAHTETVNAIKEERDTAKAELEALKKEGEDSGKLKEDLEKANKELEALKNADWEKKYKDMKAEYDTFKSDTEAKETKAKKEAAYKQLLVDAGVSQKRIDSVLKVSTESIEKIELDAEGKIKDADKLTESVKKEWADFIVTESGKGADVSNPPDGNGNNGGGQPSRAAILTAQYRNAHYGNPLNEGGTKEE